MRHTHDVIRRVVVPALGILLLVDVLRVFLPSIITIFGQAASTPAELMGAFALAWFLAGLAAPPLVRRYPAVTVGAAVLLAAARTALMIVHGGQPQLYVAAAGTLAGIVLLCGSTGAGLVPGVPLGLVLAAAQHAALGTLDLTWRGSWWAWSLLAVQVAVFLWYAVSTRSDDSPGGGWLLLGPALLLTGMYALSPAALVAGSTVVPDVPWAAALSLVGVLVLFAGSVFAGRVRPDRPVRWVAFGGLVASAAMFGFAGLQAGLLRPAALLGAVSLGYLLGAASLVPDRRPAWALALGMVVFAVAAVPYYAAYDLGFPNGWVPVAVALVFVPLRSPSEAAATLRWRPLALAAGVAALIAPVGLWWNPPAPGSVSAGGDLRLVAYNIRMGFGLDGTHDPAALARVVAGQRPDVVVLSEVDRAWLLNGGHETLTELARALRMRYVFAPAADAVWGDAVLTNLPVLRHRSVALSAVGAPTGAQALGVVVRAGSREIAVVSTHIQPPPDGPPLVQAREIASFAESFAGGRPVAVAGDLNITPGSAAWDVFVRAGFSDGFAAARPVPTFPGDRPVKEIDHVLVRGLTGSDVVVPRSGASDHAAVAVTLS